MTMAADKEVYFASKEPKDVAYILLEKSKTFFNVLESNSFLEKLRKMWRAYYGAYQNDVGYGHQIDFTGEQGEYVSMPVNHFRNLAQHIYVMITQNRPTMDARAVNTDYKSLAQTYVANSVLDYYMREKRLEDAIKKATEMAVVLGAGYIKLEWNATAGELYDVDPDTGEFNYEGEVEFTNLSPMDVVVDGTKESWNNEWILTRTYANRFNLMAKYPEHADKIKGLPSKNDATNYRLTVFTNDDTDDVAVYEFFHKRTEAMPDGRYLLFVDSDIVLLDTKMPYRTMPIFRIAANDILGTPYGYSPIFDVFPLQEAMNALYSSIMTNQNAFGVQNVFVPRNANLSVANLDSGMNVIEGDAEPKPLNLANTPKEIFDFLQMLIRDSETISGVNSVARGNPESSLKSGTALALVQSMSLQFMSGLQQSYVKLIEDVGTALLQILKDFATTPKVIAMVGKNNRSYLREFTGESISAINRVVVDVGNPLSRTLAGRVQMAEQMMQMKLIVDPKQYFQILETGRLEVSFEGEMSELLLIKSENEKLLDGDNPIVSPLDEHKTHIMEHRAVLADPDLRSDPVLVKVVLDHIENHMNMLKNTDPALLNLIGEQSLAPPPPGPPPGMPAGPSGPVPPPMGPPPQAPSMMMPPGMPNMPHPAHQMHPGAHHPHANHPAAHAIAKSRVPGILEEANPGAPGANVIKGGQHGGSGHLPNLPHPPAPFEHLPVLANQVIPGSQG